MELRAMRAAVKQALDGMDLRVYDYMALSPDPPAAVIYPDSIPSQETFGGLRRPVLIVQLLAPMSNPQAGTRMLDDWISTGTSTSVIDRSESSDLANYTVSSPSVRNYRPVLSGEQNTVTALGAELVFDIM